MSGFTAALSPMLPKASAAKERTFTSSSFKTSISGFTAVVSPTFPKALAAEERTFESSSFKAKISSGTSVDSNKDYKEPKA